MCRLPIDTSLNFWRTCQQRLLYLSPQPLKTGSSYSERLVKLTPKYFIVGVKGWCTNLFEVGNLILLVTQGCMQN